MIVITLTLITFAVLVIGTTWSGAKSDDASAFLVARREIGPLPLLASVVGNLRDGAGLAAWMILGSAFGWGALWLTVGLCAGLMCLMAFASEARRLARAHDALSVEQIVHAQWGWRTALAVRVLVVFTAFFYGAGQIFVVGKLIESIYGVGSEIGIVLAITFVGTYLVIGGFRATIVSGIVQFVAIMAIIFIPFMIEGGVPWSAIKGVLSADIQTSVGFVALSILVTIASFDLWQLIFSTRSDRAAEAGLGASIPSYFVVSVGLVLLANTISVLAAPQTAPNEALFAALSSAPSLFAGLLAAFVVAAVMSTLDSQVYLVASSLASVTTMSPVTASTKLRTSTKTWICILLTVMGFVALTISDLVQFLFSIITIGTIAVPVIVVTMIRKAHWLRLDSLGLFSVLVGTIVYIVLLVGGYLSNVLLTSVPALMGGVVLLVAAIVRYKRTNSLSTTER